MGVEVVECLDYNSGIDLSSIPEGREPLKRTFLTG